MRRGAEPTFQGETAAGRQSADVPWVRRSLGCDAVTMLQVDAASDRTLVRLRAAGKRYRWRSSWVLRDINVTVDRGCLVEVRGPNGAGKSTLLRMLAGVVLPTRGHRVVAAGLGVGYGPERLAPAPPFPTVAYLAHHARLRGVPRDEGEHRMAALAERLGLTASLLAEPLRALSKGSLQKVVVIQALLGRPALVVLDEPFAGLDVEAAGALDELIGEVAAEGSTVVFSDHRERAARLRTDVVWSVSDGKVQAGAADRPPIDLLRLPGLIDTRAIPGGRVRLLAASQASDRILAILVSNDWHVLTVAGDAEPGRTVIEAAPGSSGR